MNKLRAYVIGGCTVSTVVVLLFFLNIAASDTTVTIHMNDEGFSPEEVTVAEGSVVTWENTGTRPRWPASASHPTHEAYPEGGGNFCIGSTFDACEGIEPGESWSFTFQQRGTWSFHDHLAPGLQGVVVVSPRPLTERVRRYFKRAWVAVMAQMFDRDKYVALPSAETFLSASKPQRRTYIKTASADSPAAAWEYLKDVATKDGTVTLNVHELAHIIGNNIYKKFDIDGITICDATFAFGCYHGVTEQLFQTHGPGSVAATAERCRAIFKDGDGGKSDTGLIGYSGCIHGMGHGLLTWEALNVDRALAGCDTLEKSERPFCYDGVFMEYSTAAPNDKLSVETAWDFCAARSGQHRTQCARYLPNLLRKAHNLSTADVARVCTRAPDEDLRSLCARSIGYYVGQTTRGDIDRIQEMCVDGFSALDSRYECLEAAAGELIFQGYASWRENAEAICSSMPQPQTQQCRDNNHDVAQSYGRI